MPYINRNFIKGRMNKAVDERLVPQGEYIDALNIRLGSSEDDEIGTVENAKGNEKLSNILYAGFSLSSSAKCIGAVTDDSNETLYWFIHDSNFSSTGATGKLDLIVSYNASSGNFIRHIVSIDDGGGANTTLNFDDDYLIQADIVDDLIFFTDNLNQPRKFNINRKYPLPTSGRIDRITEEDLRVVKKPPLSAPTVTTVSANTDDDYMKDKFLCFAYRYKYADGEYSATSQFSQPAFVPGPFSFSAQSVLNEGMENTIDTALIDYETGNDLVKEIELLFKEADDSSIKVIEKINKADNGLANNTTETYTFRNKKIFTTLPDAELLRLYDNVPILAQAQAIVSNRLMYGNYKEGYNLVDSNGEDVKLNYSTSVINEQVGVNSLDDALVSADFTIDGAVSQSQGAVRIDITDQDLNAGARLDIDFTFRRGSTSGDTTGVLQETTSTDIQFSFTLPRDYTSGYDLVNSDEFQDYVGTASNIKPVFAASGETSCDGNTFTDIFNCSIPNNLSGFPKFESGISSAGQPVSVDGTNVIEIQLPAMRFVDDTSSITQEFYEYYEITNVEATLQTVSNVQSLHSNIGYEVGIVYMDDYLRASTALVSTDNSVWIPCSASDTKNSIQVRIPTSQKAPEWASKYKFVIKPTDEIGETIYSNISFEDPANPSQTYFLLQGENARKVEEGDRLLVKRDSSGPTFNCRYATVLEKKAQEEGFITVVGDATGSSIDAPAGVYMLMKTTGFSTERSEYSYWDLGNKEASSSSRSSQDFPHLYYRFTPLNTSGAYIDINIPAGSIIKLFFEFERIGPGDGDRACEKRYYVLDKQLTSSSDYADFEEFWNGDNVAQVLNEGTQDVGGNGGDVDNKYLTTTYPVVLASGEFTSLLFNVVGDLETNFFAFGEYTGGSGTAKFLCISGTKACGTSDKRTSTVRANIQIFRPDGTLVFETEGAEANPDIFYESSKSYDISGDNHLGDTDAGDTSQDISGGTPGIINTDFFNCYAFGNGVESFRIRDSIIGKPLTMGNRVTSVSEQDYKRAHRFADITYSGVYNDETNLNKLNEFNAGLLNFKPLEDFYGPIRILDTKQTDVFVLQEDKVSYVLAGKDILSDAAAGSAITAVPQVLGNQIAQPYQFGISNNPESYVRYGAYRFWQDAKRGSVIQMAGDQLEVVSNYGMDDWFRDLYNDSFNTQKLGGYDPYMEEYVVASNDIALPAPVQDISCPDDRTITVGVDTSTSYTINLGRVVGDVTIDFEVSSIGSGTTFKVEGTYDGTTVSSGFVSASGSITVDKDKAEENELLVEITTSGGTDDLVLDVTTDCPASDDINIIQIAVTGTADEGDLVHAQYNFTEGTYDSPTQSTQVSFQDGDAPIASLYKDVSGQQGGGTIPTDGATVTVYSSKEGVDDFTFDPAQNGFLFLRTDTLYGNNQSDIISLLSAASSTGAITTVIAGELYSSSFTMPSTGQYLYIVYDFRTSTSSDLCFSTVSTDDACCNC